MPEGVETNLQELLALRTDAAQLKFNARKTANAGLVSRSPSHFRARGMDYFDTRVYVEGDDIRNIDWRVSARTGKLHSKVYIEERDRPVLLLLDFSASMYFGTRHALKSVKAARLAALLAWFAVQKGDRVGSLIFTPAGEQDIRPASGDKAVINILSALCDATRLHSKADGENQLEYALQHAAQVARPGSLIFLISDFYAVNASLLQPLHQLAAHNDIVSFFMSDPIERELPDINLPLGNAKQRMILRPQHKQQRAQIIEHYQQRIAWAEQALGNLGQSIIPVSTADPLLDVFSQSGGY